MHDNEDENLRVGAEGAPMASPDVSLLEEEKALRSGNWRMLAVMIGAAVVFVGAVVYYMTTGDSQQYSNFGRNVNQLHQEHFHKFWQCAFQGPEQRQIQNDQQLREAIHRRARNGRNRYGAHVRDRCLNDLRDLPVQLRALIAPEEYSESVRQMADAVTTLQGGWNDFAGQLVQAEDSYDEEGNAEAIERIARGWYDYRRHHSQLNRDLETKLEQAR